MPADHMGEFIDESDDGDDIGVVNSRGREQSEPTEPECAHAFALIEDCSGWSRFIGLGGEYARGIFVVSVAALCDLGCCALLEFGCGMCVRSCISNHLFLCWLVSFG